MRGQDTQQAGMFSGLSPEERVPVTHPLRPIRQYVDMALTALSPQLARLYAHTGRPRLPRRSCCAPCCCRCSTASAVNGS